MRLQHWVKNLIIFTPLFSSSTLTYHSVVLIFSIFFSFSLCVSSTYIINDLVDLDSDKLHPNKKLRPVASGVYPKNYWLLFSTVLLIVGNLLLFSIDKKLIILSSLYTFLTLLYSFKLKYVKLFDLVSISALFVLRLFVGGVTLKIPISLYLLFFVLFTSLGIVSSKKISIMKNGSLPNSEIKRFLNNNYSSTFLNNLMYSSFSIATLTYFLWIIDKKESIDSIQLLFLIISLASIALFKYIFITRTMKNETEEIIESIKENNSLRLLSLSSLIFSLLGLLW